MADMTPPPAARPFLRDAGWGEIVPTPLAGDASFRRYFRVTDGDRRAVLMDAPPPEEDVRPFLAMARWLSARGLRAPAILAADEAAGLVLLEDFGDARLREQAEANPARETGLYEAAVDVLVALHRLPAAPVPAYDLSVLHREAALLPEWYGPAVGLEVDAAGYADAWDRVLGAALPPDPPVTVLRDHHSENLMVLPDGELGLLDFQDALAGHPAYDLVSLLQDARRDVDPTLEARMIERYRASAGADPGFDDAYHVLGAQRNAKILGIFARLWRRDGKPRYAALCPRVWRYLERDLAHPALAPVAEWFAANVPPEKRGDPMLPA